MILALGSKVIFDEEPESVRLAVEVSKSPTVKAIAEVAVPAVVV